MTTITTAAEWEDALRIMCEAGEPMVVREGGFRLWIITESEWGDTWAWSWFESEQDDEREGEGPGGTVVPAEALRLPLEVIVRPDAPPTDPAQAVERAAQVIHADHPSVTDDARVEAERRWGDRRTSDRLPSDWLDEGMASGFVLGAQWAAGRAETRGSDDPDGVVLDFLRERADFVRALKASRDQDADYYRWSGHAEARRHLAQRLGLDHENLPDGAAGRAETTTATTEEAARVIDSTRYYTGSRMHLDETKAAHALNERGLLARPTPSRDQIAAVLHHEGEDVPDGYTLTPETCDTCRHSLRDADAVLGLLEGGGDE